MRVEIWTDGSCPGPGEPGGYAAILRAHKDGRLHEREVVGSMPCATNNRAEMMALLEGARALTRASDLLVYTDSQYLANPFTKGWLVRWANTGWRRKGKAKEADRLAAEGDTLHQCPQCAHLAPPGACPYHSDPVELVPDIDLKMIANKDLWMELGYVLAPHQTEFRWVRGHDGTELNERADRLAVAARKAEQERRAVAA